jgi:hypothetical protein
MIVNRCRCRCIGIGGRGERIRAAVDEVHQTRVQMQIGDTGQRTAAARQTHAAERKSANTEREREKEREKRERKMMHG